MDLPGSRRAVLLRRPCSIMPLSAAGRVSFAKCFVLFSLLTLPLLLLLSPPSTSLLPLPEGPPPCRWAGQSSAGEVVLRLLPRLS